MRASTTFGVVLLALVGSGCVSRSTYQALEQQLEECRRDKASAQDARDFCEARYSREVERWDNIESVVKEALPQTLREFRAERERILKLVPIEAQEQVDSYLNEFSRAVAKGFETMQSQNDRILEELELYKAAIHQVDDRTRSIDDTVRQRLAVEAAHRARTADAITAVVGRIHEFDRTHVNDRASQQRLKLNRKQREAITLFHDDLVRELLALQQSLTAEAAAPGS